MAQLSSLSGYQSSAFFLKFALPIAAFIHAGLLFLPRPPEAPTTPKNKPEAIEVDLAALPDRPPNPSPIAKPIVAPPLSVRPKPIQAAVSVPPLTANQLQQVQPAPVPPPAQSVQAPPVQPDPVQAPAQKPQVQKPQVQKPQVQNNLEEPAQPQSPVRDRASTPTPNITPVQPPNPQPSATPIVTTGTDALTQLGAINCGQRCFQLASGQTFQDFEQVMTQRFQAKPQGLCNEEGHRIGYVVQNAQKQPEYWYSFEATGVGQTLIVQYQQRSERLGQPCE